MYIDGGLKFMQEISLHNHAYFPQLSYVGMEVAWDTVGGVVHGKNVTKLYG